MKSEWTLNWLAGEAVWIEPVSDDREYIAGTSETCVRIPYFQQQGISRRERGIIFRKQEVKWRTRRRLCPAAIAPSERFPAAKAGYLRGAGAPE